MLKHIKLMMALCHITYSVYCSNPEQIEYITLRLLVECLEDSGNSASLTHNACSELHINEDD